MEREVKYVFQIHLKKVKVIICELMTLPLTPINFLTVYIMDMDDT